MMKLADGTHEINHFEKFGFVNDPNFEDWSIEVIVKNGEVVAERGRFQERFQEVHPWPASIHIKEEAK